MLLKGRGESALRYKEGGGREAVGGGGVRFIYLFFKKNEIIKSKYIARDIFFNVTICPNI